MCYKHNYEFKNLINTNKIETSLSNALIKLDKVIDEHPNLTKIVAYYIDIRQFGFIPNKEAYMECEVFVEDPENYDTYRKQDKYVSELHINADEGRTTIYMYFHKPPRYKYAYEERMKNGVVIFSRYNHS